MKEFQPLVEYFELENWVHLRCVEEIFRIRLLDYEIDYDDLCKISVTFSDAKKEAGGALSDVASIIKQAQSVATNYGYVARQAKPRQTGGLGK